MPGFVSFNLDPIDPDTLAREGRISCPLANVSIPSRRLRLPEAHIGAETYEARCVAHSIEHPDEFWAESTHGFSIRETRWNEVCDYDFRHRVEASWFSGSSKSECGGQLAVVVIWRSAATRLHWSGRAILPLESTEITYNGSGEQVNKLASVLTIPGCKKG